MGQFHKAEPGLGHTRAWQRGACESRRRPPELGNRVPCIGACVEGAPCPIALRVSHLGEGGLFCTRLAGVSLEWGPSVGAVSPRPSTFTSALSPDRPRPHPVSSRSHSSSKGERGRGWVSFSAPTSRDSPQRLGLRGGGGWSNQASLSRKLGPALPPHKPYTRPPHTLRSPRPSSPDLSQPGCRTQRCCHQRRCQVRLCWGLRC